MYVLVLQLCIIKEIRIVVQFEFLQQVADDQFMATRYTDIVCKDQRLTNQEFLIKVISVIDDKCFPAFHVQCAIIDAICFIAVDLSGYCGHIPSYTQITV